MLEQGDARALQETGPLKRLTEAPSFANNQILADGQKQHAKAAAPYLHHVAIDGASGSGPKGGSGIPVSDQIHSKKGNPIGGVPKSSDVAEPPLYKNQPDEQRMLPNGFTETTKYSPGRKDVEARDEYGRLRTQDIFGGQAKEGKLDSTIHRSWNDKMQLQEDNQRWKDTQGVWHERNFMQTADNTKINTTMDGDRTRIDTTTPDGKTSTEIRTANALETDPDTGKLRKTLKIERFDAN